MAPGPRRRGPALQAGRGPLNFPRGASPACSLQDEVVLLELYHSVLLHPSQLPGHGAAVHSEAVGHLLPVAGDEEVVGAGPPGLIGKEGAYLLPGGPLGHLVEPHVEGYRVPGKGHHQVLHEPLMEPARCRTDICDLPDVEEHDLARRDRHHADIQVVPRRAGVLAADLLPFPVLRHDGAVAPPVLLDGFHLPVQDDPYPVDAVAPAEQELALGVPDLIGSHALRHLGDLAFLDPLEQGRGLQHLKIPFHVVKTTSPLYLTHDLWWITDCEVTT